MRLGASWRQLNWHRDVINARRRHLYSLTTCDRPGIVVGVTTPAEGDKSQHFSLTESGEKLNSFCGGSIASRLAASGSLVKPGSSWLLGQVHPDLGPVVAVGLGQLGARGVDTQEEIDLDREAVRTATAAGVRALASIGVKEVEVDSCGDAEAAAEGATLANWRYDRFKADKKPGPSLRLLGEDTPGWASGIRLATAQNFARELAEAPANYLTPTQFVEEAARGLAGLNVSVKALDRAWAEEQGMGAFLSVARGSYQPPQFLEMVYRGGDKDAEPIVLVGKGVTFDTGGISIKPAAKMDKMRGDMGGAAAVTATIKAVSEAGLGVNLVVLVPLTENMPGGRATRPGDVVTAMNGKTIQVDNTDAEGRLILADALCYADKFNPRMVLDVATLTGAIHVALGAAATGVYSTNTEVYRRLAEAGQLTGDRVWRMPLWRHYTDKIKKSTLADLNNISLTPGGGSCTAAAFLREFTKCPTWLHLDMAGVMENEGAVPYLGEGMSGRPTRTLVKFIEKSL